MLLLKILIAAVLPVVVFVAGASIMAKATDRKEVLKRLASADPGDSKPLGQRLRYDLPAVERYLGALGPSILSERRFLEMDLIFPFLYGAALASGLLIVWIALGRPISTAYLMAPVAMTMLADWIENTVQLGQIHRYLAGGAGALDPNLIQIASAATFLKLLFFLISALLLLALIGISIFRAIKPH